MSDPIHSPMSKADAIVLDSVHVDGKISLYCIEYKFDRSIDRIVWWEGRRDDAASIILPPIACVAVPAIK